MVQGLYVHIPFCRSKCGYCGFYSIAGASGELQAAYIVALERELNFLSLDLSSLRTIYVGGGSPSLLSEANLAKLLQLLARYSDIEEYSFELNPEQVTGEKLRLLKDCGVNRLSFGAQSFNEKNRFVLGRAGAVEHIYNALELARRAGFENLSLDVIAGAPGMGAAELLCDLQNAVKLEPKHISCYSLSVEENTPLERALRSGQCRLLDEEQQRECYLLAHEFLEDAGFRRYEVSNYAFRGFECRHNMLYWTGREYLGTGASAGSFFDLTRRQNVADVHGYIESAGVAFVSEKITAQDYAWQTAVLMLRLSKGVCCRDYHEITGFDFAAVFSEQIEKNITAGLMEQAGESYRLTGAGMLLANLISEDFVL
ncbi:MAG: radical SAM family heme chaperone HemW [Phycisphaerae bacterium]